MATSRPPSNPTRVFGRIRVDEITSQDLVLILDRELATADGYRRRAGELENQVLINDTNRYMRRLRRVLNELVRTREEMGWSDVQLSELARRS